MTAETVDTQSSSNQRLVTLTPTHWIGVVLATITGLIHLWLGVANGKAGLLVAGIGFALGITAILVGFRRRFLVRLGIPFTAGQILLYFVAHTPNFTAIELGDKVVQVALVAVLVALARRG